MAIALRNARRVALLRTADCTAKAHGHQGRSLDRAALPGRPHCAFSQPPAELIALGQVSIDLGKGRCRSFRVNDLPNRHALPDKVRDRLAPLLPAHSHRERRCNDHRTVINGSLSRTGDCRQMIAIIHDFVLLKAITLTQAPRAAITQAASYLQRPNLLTAPCARPAGRACATSIFLPASRPPGPSALKRTELDVLSSSGPANQLLASRADSALGSLTLWSVGRAT